MTDLHDDPNDMTSIDLDQPATRRDLLELRREIVGVRGELRGDITDLRKELRGEIAGLRTELTEELTGQLTQLRSHFDLVAEAFRADFRNLFDWTHATTESLDRRLHVVERDHGQALSNLDLRVTSLEHKPR